MALIGKIIRENTGSINIRPSEVIADVIIEKDYFQLRSYAAGDTEREKGSKQNIQLSKEKAKEVIKLLEEYVSF
jgi:hypothetical protein